MVLLPFAPKIPVFHDRLLLHQYNSIFYNKISSKYCLWWFILNVNSNLPTRAPKTKRIHESIQHSIAVKPKQHFYKHFMFSNYPKVKINPFSLRRHLYILPDWQTSYVYLCIMGLKGACCPMFFFSVFIFSSLIQLEKGELPLFKYFYVKEEESFSRLRL